MSGQQQDRRTKRPRPPLDPSTIRALALHYLGRFATTRHRLQHYLERKIRERGWAEEENPPDIDSLVAEFADRGYVDDAVFGEARANSMLRRGYGAPRVNAALRHAGIAADLAGSLSDLDSEAARDAALNFARRKRIGPFGAPVVDQKARAKALAAFLRAGHRYEIAREIIDTVTESSDSADFFH